MTSSEESKNPIETPSSYLQCISPVDIYTKNPSVGGRQGRCDLGSPQIHPDPIYVELPHPGVKKEKKRSRTDEF